VGFLASDKQHRKTGYSAFYPGNCDLVDELMRQDRAQLVFAGLLTDVCVGASVRDAFEAGFEVRVCSDACGANEDWLHQSTLFTTARCYGDVCSSQQLVDEFSKA